MTTQHAVAVSHEELLLRFPRGDFTDTHVRGLVASRSGSNADVQVEPWSEQRISQWYIDKDRFERVGRRIAWVIRRAGRDPRGTGFVQQVAVWCHVPLIDPPKSSGLVTGCNVNGKGWLDGAPYVFTSDDVGKLLVDPWHEQ